MHLQAEELAKSKLEKPKRLQQQAHRDWQEIKRGSHKFQRRQQEAAAVRALQKSDLLAFFQVFQLQVLHWSIDESKASGVFKGCLTI